MKPAQCLVTVIVLLAAASAAAAGKAPVRSLLQGTPAAAFDPTTTYATPLAAAVAAQDNLSTLIRLVQLANLTAPLNSTTTAWTIFAPTNDAFEAALTTLGITAAELVEDPATLAMLLSYHVVPSPALSTDLAAGASLPTLLEGKNLTVASISPSVVIAADLSNATVAIANIRAGASVIHVIDTVLLPNPDMNVTGGNVTAAEGPATLLEAVAATPELSVLAQAVGAANLTGVLNDTETVWTVFAPNNEAMLAAVEALGLTPAELLANTTLLTSVLNFHMVPGVAANSSSLMAGMQVPTLLEGANLTVATISPNVTIQGGSPDNLVTVIRPDIIAGKSIVHIVDGVLLPPSDMSPEVTANQGPAAAAPAAPAPVAGATPAPSTSSSGSAAGVAAVGAVVTALAAVVVAL